MLLMNSSSESPLPRRVGFLSRLILLLLNGAPQLLGWCFLVAGISICVLMFSSPLDAAFFFSPFLLFLLIGLGFVGIGMFNGLSMIRLLRWGTLATAEFHDSEPTHWHTGVFGGWRRGYRLYFRYTASDDRPRYVSVMLFYPEKYGPGSTVSILYDPEDPENAVILDTLPAGVTLKW